MRVVQSRGAGGAWASALKIILRKLKARTQATRIGDTTSSRTLASPCTRRACLRSCSALDATDPVLVV